MHLIPVSKYETEIYESTIIVRDLNSFVSEIDRSRRQESSNDVVEQTATPTKWI